MPEKHVSPLRKLSFPGGLKKIYDEIQMALSDFKRSFYVGLFSGHYFPTRSFSKDKFWRKKLAYA